jgi:hypothetical protein
MAVSPGTSNSNSSHHLGPQRIAALGGTGSVVRSEEWSLLDHESVHA